MNTNQIKQIRINIHDNSRNYICSLVSCKKSIRIYTMKKVNGSEISEITFQKKLSLKLL